MLTMYYHFRKTDHLKLEETNHVLPVTVVYFIYLTGKLNILFFKYLNSKFYTFLKCKPLKRISLKEEIDILSKPAAF